MLDSKSTLHSDTFKTISNPCYCETIHTVRLTAHLQELRTQENYHILRKGGHYTVHSFAVNHRYEPAIYTRTGSCSSTCNAARH